ncbi:cation diffusion facilitator family transporter [Methylomagnum sp.]
MAGHNHVHFPPPGQQTQVRLALALFVTLSFVIIEAVAGYLANSLALLTDAAHNLTDVGALALTWYAFRLADQPAHSGKTFGYHRVGILAALVNSTTLALIAAGIFYEAYQRFLTPTPVSADILMSVGAAALLVNLLTAWLVSHGAHGDLNLRSAFLHLLGDVFSTLGAILAGVGIWLTGLNWFDPLASILIGLLILWNAWLILRETVDILLESTPRDIEMSTMVRDLMQIEGVRGVHDLHVWSLSQSLRLLSAHIVVDDMPVSRAALMQHEISELAAEKYGVGHATLQIECEGCDPDALYCDITQRNHHHHDHDYDHKHGAGHAHHVHG